MATTQSITGKSLPNIGEQTVSVILECKEARAIEVQLYKQLYNGYLVLANLTAVSQ